MGPPDSSNCKQDSDTFIQLCSSLGISLVSEKIKDPTSSLTFLGVTIDTSKMEIRLPKDKPSRIQEMLEQWLGKKNATKWKILSLLGHLQHASKVVRCGRTFTSRMYATAAKVKNCTIIGGLIDSSNQTWPGGTPLSVTGMA